MGQTNNTPNSDEQDVQSNGPDTASEETLGGNGPDDVDNDIDTSDDLDDTDGDEVDEDDSEFSFDLSDILSNEDEDKDEGEESDDGEDDDTADNDDEDTDEDDGQEPETFDRDYVENLRRENAKYRQRAKTASDKAVEGISPVLDAVTEIIGDDFDYDNATAESLADALRSNVGKRDKQLQKVRTETAVSNAARKHKADATRMQDSVRFNKELAAIDPGADDFDAQVDELVGGFSKDFASPSAPPSRSGADFQAGSGAGDSDDGFSVDALIRKRRKRNRY